ncbi:alpha-tectorin-like [Thamnophis elegans]|uniref:alpha-tectorin-like n=1 Tax=Thamnophis elegans TaxID=35005 RepID=UPI001376FE17|nr:alpha-tectorin-like [Thamnophis elegans]
MLLLPLLGVPVSVDKVLTRLSVRKLNNALKVDIVGRYVTLETDFGLIVSYDTDHSVEIRVPTTFFNKTCGMCGNFNNLGQDDSMMPNGEQAQNSNQLGNSWQVPNAEYDPPDCIAKPPPPPCPSELKDLYETEAYCGQLTSSQGPLAACHSAINPNSFFQNCVFDLCELHGSQQALCGALEAYADACQRAGVQLPDWRNATSCEIPCHDHSHYNVCATSCPATCSNPLAPWNCTKPCVEDCECDKGFVLSGAQCVPQEDCGCVDGDQYYEVCSPATSSAATTEPAATFTTGQGPHLHLGLFSNRKERRSGSRVASADVAAKNTESCPASQTIAKKTKSAKYRTAS